MSANQLVLTWNIIHGLSELEVWQEHRQQRPGVPPIYDTGLERLSCVYCFLAGPEWLILATRVCFALELPHPRTFAELERRIGHSFKQDFTLNAIIAAARMLDALDGAHHLAPRRRRTPSPRAGCGRPVPRPHLLAPSVQPPCPTVTSRNEFMMTSTLTSTPTALQENDYPPGHSPIFWPPEGPESALACTCGGLLVLKPDTQPAQRAVFALHLEEVRREAHVD
ncbi:hypothetical protein ACIQGT_25810 [Streptomyces sp. NPDC093108]|uniref:hypothetical protein n=1 Tax=Streptomyces sp. NPDC093108 TaxID=3366030 RepID=UPI0038228C15